jgi:hypothetical protein
MNTGLAYARMPGPDPIISVLEAAIFLDDVTQKIPVRAVVVENE